MTHSGYKIISSLERMTPILFCFAFTLTLTDRNNRRSMIAPLGKELRSVSKIICGTEDHAYGMISLFSFG
jgi:hypothetical protein